MGAAWHGRAEKYAEFWWENLKEKGHSEELSIDGTILRLILKWKSEII
jgi:hypothetical protein